uniref:ERI1 exoribonuclease 2 n=1 Tax=Lepisosteus oculatus TaxID=7918 RepID=W5LXK3_LEPOC
MATKLLAKKLGLIRKRSQPSSNGAQRRPGAKQFFSYLVVIDFESTCWRDKNHCSPEIIEFPAVLLNTSNGRIDSEFHTYVQPQEHPTLSEFCTELTGIRQSQVEAGVPLKICLSQFNKWLQTLQQEENIVFVNDLVRPSDSVANPCTFVTWSDWDLGVCLQYECKRKQLHRPDALNSWIDLRAMYKSFYNRKPKGLTGALQDLGIKFSGREHSGLDDARNTAHLAWRMITDGCVMKITKCLERVNSNVWVSQVKPDPGNRCANSEAARDNHHGNCVARGENNTEDRQTKSVLEQVKLDHVQRKQSSKNKEVLGLRSNNENHLCQSLVYPKTLFHGLMPCVAQENPPVPKSISSGTLVTINSPTVLSTNQVLVSTMVDCVTDVSDLASYIATDSETVLGEWEGNMVIPAVDEGRSYDSVVLEDPEKTDSVRSPNWTFSQKFQQQEDGVLTNSKTSNEVLFKRPNPAVRSTANVSVCPSNRTTCRVPNFSSPAIRPAKGAKQTSLSSMSFFTKPQKGSSSLTVYKNPVCPSNSSLSSNRSDAGSAPPPVLASLVSGSSSGKVTPPLCGCGRRSKRLRVSNGGPNHGRAFYRCPAGPTVSGRNGNCGFFKWEAALGKGKPAAAAWSRSWDCRDRSTSSEQSFAGGGSDSAQHRSLRPSLRT